MHEGPRSGENAKGGGFYSPLRNLWERALFIPGIPPDFWMQISTLVGIKDNSGAGPSSVIVPAFFHRLRNVSVANRHPSRTCFIKIDPERAETPNLWLPRAARNFFNDKPPRIREHVWRTR
jgi:hypothetical protein